MKVAQSCPTLYNPMDYPGQNTEVGSLSLLQRIFPIQGLNPGLPHCQRVLYQLSHKGSPWILEWVAYPYSRGSSWPRNRTGVSSIAGRFFTNWAIKEARDLFKKLTSEKSISSSSTWRGHIFSPGEPRKHTIKQTSKQGYINQHWALGLAPECRGLAPDQCLLR